MKYCYGCDKKISTDNFNKSKRNIDGMRSLCKTCTHKANKISREIVRLEVLTHYSNGKPKCACCSEDKLEFLSIDHINNDGGNHRKSDPSSKKIVHWLKRNKLPDGFAVLCINCNFSKGRYGYCPHTVKSKILDILPENYHTVRKYKLWGAKLTIDEVKEIRRRVELGENKNNLANYFKVSKATISNIISGRRWSSV